MIADLSRFVADAMPKTRLTSTQTTKLRKQILAAVADQVLPSLPLEVARSLAASGHGRVLDETLRDLTFAQLKAVSKVWNPHRPVGASVIPHDLQTELRELLQRRREPVCDPATIAVMGLDDARAEWMNAPSRLRDSLAVMSEAQLKKTLLAWDKHVRGVEPTRLRPHVASLLGRTIEPALDPKSLSQSSLTEVHELFRQRGAKAVADAIASMTYNQCKAANKAWDPHRKLPADVEVAKLRSDLVALASERRAPSPAPIARASARPRAVAASVSNRRTGRRKA